jgi:hypothetical protein
MWLTEFISTDKKYGFAKKYNNIANKENKINKKE